MMTLPSPPPDELRRLAEKYRTMGELRRARARGEAVPPREVFKALADAFPGCLNELDTLPLDDIDARAEALARAADGGAVEAWMGWLSGYHALLRAALRIKLRLSRRRDCDEARAEALAKDATAHVGGIVTIDAGFVRRVAEPPGGRLNAVVFAQLEVLSGEPASVIKRAIFPRGRA